MILTTNDIVEGRTLRVTIFGEDMRGECIGQSRSGPIVRWEDGATATIRDGFLAECSSVGIDFNGVFNV